MTRCDDCKEIEACKKWANMQGPEPVCPDAYEPEDDDPCEICVDRDCENC